MTQVPDLQQGKPNKLLPQYFGSAILIIAFIVFAGWQFNSIILAGFVKGVGAMHPFVAISFIAIGLFFIVDRIRQKSVLKQILSFGLPLIAITVGSITIAQFIFNFSSPIESLFYPEKLIAFGYKNVPNHITVCTALELLLTGGTLFLMNFKGRRLDILINNLAAFTGLICLLSYISCVYLVHEFNILVFITAMAIPTGVCLLLSSLAIICSRPNSGLMSAFTTSYPGNRTARTFLPLSIVIPVVFGLFTVYILRHNVVTTEVGMTLLFTSLILSMFILTWYLGAQINKTNIEQSAAEKLRKSEFYYRSIIEHASDSIILTNIKGNFSEVNSSACELLGYTRDELLKLNIDQLIDPEQLKSDPIDLELLMIGQPIVKERRMIHKNGTTIEARVNVKMLPDGRVLAFVYDITERKKTELQLRKSEAKFKALVENNFDAITLLNSDFKPIYRSPSVIKLTGWTDQERQNHERNYVLHPDDLEHVTETYKKVMANEGMPFSHSYRIKHKEGYYIWVEAVTRNMLSDPDIGAIVVIMRNITERKYAELQLAKSEARFKALVEDNFDCIALYDSHLNIIYRSPSTERITGWTNEDLKTQNNFAKVHPDDVESAENSYKEVLNNPGKAIQNAYRLKHKDGHYIWAEFVTRNMLNDPNLGSIVTIFRDISERKNAEEKLLKYNRELFMLNHVNDAIVRYKDEDALMNQTCRLLADYGNYPLAWIGFAPDHGGPYQRILPITKAGKEIKYLDSIVIDHVDEKMKKGPVAIALTTGKLRIINDIKDDPYFEPWRESAKKHGLASIIALPFDISEKRKGILVIYSSQPDAFDRDEVTILQRITENLAHAIRGIRIARERDQAIKQIVKSEEKYRLLFESSPLPMWIFSIPDSAIIDVNEAAINHYGYSKEEFIKMNLEKLRPAEDIEKFIRSYQQNQKNDEGISNFGIWRHKKKNGEIINVEILAQDMIYEGKRVRLILSTDITEKLKADKELHQMNEQLRQFSAHLQNAREDERTKIAREIHDELGQLLTGLKIDVSWLSKKLDSSPKEISKRVDEMVHLTDRTIQSVRRIATELRPGILDDLGLEDAIMWQASEFQNKTGIKCDVEGNLKIKKYSSEVSTAAFRILQESLTNIMRHANAKNVMIKMNENENALHLEVIDDGSGMAHINQNGGQSLGIMGMRERAAIIGGSLSITSEPFKGTKIRVEIPFKSLS